MGIAVGVAVGVAFAYSLRYLPKVVLLSFFFMYVPFPFHGGSAYSQPCLSRDVCAHHPAGDNILFTSYAHFDSPAALWKLGEHLKEDEAVHLLIAITLHRYAPACTCWHVVLDATGPIELQAAKRFSCSASFSHILGILNSCTLPNRTQMLGFTRTIVEALASKFQFELAPSAYNYCCYTNR